MHLILITNATQSLMLAISELHQFAFSALYICISCVSSFAPLDAWWSDIAIYSLVWQMTFRSKKIRKGFTPIRIQAICLTFDIQHRNRAKWDADYKGSGVDSKILSRTAIYPLKWYIHSDSLATKFRPWGATSSLLEPHYTYKNT